MHRNGPLTQVISSSLKESRPSSKLSFTKYSEQQESGGVRINIIDELSGDTGFLTRSGYMPDPGPPLVHSTSPT